MRQPPRRAAAISFSLLLLLVLLAPTFLALATEDDLLRSIEFYQDRYAIRNAQGQIVDKTNPYAKLVANNGTGQRELDGTRNFRAVLPGIVYRGGANNSYRHPPRNNMNPLPPEGLASLCHEGFDRAVYLYPDRYSSAQRDTACTIQAPITPAGRPNTLEYLDLPPLTSAAHVKSILQLVHAKLTGAASPQPIYLHCWNGWHASGMASAIVLRQFCGVTAEQADRYWVCNTDGNSQGYDSVRQRIREFTPIADLSISDELKQRVCPHLDPNGCPQH
jgi:hypothetical protein